MKVLVIGSGGREHALVWKAAQSKLVDEIFCAPGNGGIADLAQCIDIKADDISRLCDFVRKEKIDLTIVGPEAPLSIGIVDEFERYKLPIFGPGKKAAQLEASKVFAKELMKKYNVPTADFSVFDNPVEAKKHIKQRSVPCVVKAEGLAAGKGVIVCSNREEAEQAVEYIMKDRSFGPAGDRIIIEDCLQGQEASILVFTDTKQVVQLASSQDHKQVYDLDKGPNTGGMGAYSPAPVVDEEINQQILETIVYPTVKGLNEEGIIYKGILYVGVMITSRGPMVLEFNARFGDPETQAILPRLNSDLIEIMLVTIKGKLNRYLPEGLCWDSRACVCVVCASGGYPGKYENGKQIFGLDDAGEMADIMVFHSGTNENMEHNKREYVTNGGRVLGVTGMGKDIKEAIEKTYRAVGKIRFEGMHYRNDIGQKAAGILSGR